LKAVKADFLVVAEGASWFRVVSHAVVAKGVAVRVGLGHIGAGLTGVPKSRTTFQLQSSCEQERESAPHFVVKRFRHSREFISVCKSMVALASRLGRLGLLLALVASPAAAFLKPNATAGVADRITFGGQLDSSTHAVLSMGTSWCTVAVEPISVLCTLVHKVDVNDVASDLTMTFTVNATIADGGGVLILAVNASAPEYLLEANKFEASALPNSFGTSTYDVAGHQGSVATVQNAGVTIVGLIPGAQTLFEVVGTGAKVRITALDYNPTWPPSARFDIGFDMSAFDPTIMLAQSRAALGNVQASRKPSKVASTGRGMAAFAVANKLPPSEGTPPWVVLASTGSAAATSPSYAFNVSYATLGLNAPAQPVPKISVIEGDFGTAERATAFLLVLLQWGVPTIVYAAVCLAILREVDYDIMRLGPYMHSKCLKCWACFTCKAKPTSRRLARQQKKLLKDRHNLRVLERLKTELGQLTAQAGEEDDSGQRRQLEDHEDADVAAAKEHEDAGDVTAAIQLLQPLVNKMRTDDSSGGGGGGDEEEASLLDGEADHASNNAEGAPGSLNGSGSNGRKKDKPAPFCERMCSCCSCLCGKSSDEEDGGDRSDSDRGASARQRGETVEFRSDTAEEEDIEMTGEDGDGAELDENGDPVNAGGGPKPMDLSNVKSCDEMTGEDWTALAFLVAAILLIVVLLI
jgi:hypothetical protein